MVGGHAVLGRRGRRRGGGVASRSRSAGCARPPTCRRSSSCSSSCCSSCRRSGWCCSVERGDPRGGADRRWSSRRSRATPPSTSGSTPSCRSPSRPRSRWTASAPRAAGAGRATAVTGQQPWSFAAGSDVPDVDGAAARRADRAGRGRCSTRPAPATRCSRRCRSSSPRCSGTMGLPHILVRFHTSPDGRGARRTAAITVATAQRVLPVPGRVRRCSARCCCRSCTSPAAPTPSSSRCPARVDTAGSRARCSPRCSPRARSPRSWRRRSGCCSRCPARSSHDLLPGTALRRLRLTTLAAAAVVVALALPAAHLDVGGARHLGVRRGRVDVLPAAGARASGGRGLTARGAAVGMVVGLLASAGVIVVEPHRGARPTAGLDAARPARALVGAARVRTMVLVSLRGTAAGVGRGRDAAAAPGRDATERR